MSDAPTLAELERWLTEQAHPAAWAAPLQGLPWSIIKPGVQIAGASKLHPLVALATAARYTADAAVRATIEEHLSRAR